MFDILVLIDHFARTVTDEWNWIDKQHKQQQQRLSVEIPANMLMC